MQWHHELRRRQARWGRKWIAPGLMKALERGHAYGNRERQGTVNGADNDNPASRMSEPPARRRTRLSNDDRFEA